ncbi:ArsR/SmtB family transcription factor [Amycolatopsis magusensis]|uniref:ArsR/SmtB family transcription factor n=1 Tax=Amycolatopsis magusensis TaxID=882444 RepID=UPI00379AD5D5
MERKTVELDSRMLRALAHPLRMRLVELLRRDGPATASGLGKRLGESSGTTSWHLRQLAEHGFVEEDAERGNRRERWWRVVHDSFNLNAMRFAGDPDLSGPLNTYLMSAAERRYEREASFFANAERWRDSWGDAPAFNDYSLSLTPEEAQELSAEVDAVVARYRRAPRDGDTAVVAHWAAFPRERHPEEP